MAKPSKLEDYWRQHNIESLFKDLTHILVQRKPPDPVAALVQHLQKKFPQSFKASGNNSDSPGVVSRTTASNLQLQSMGTPNFDAHNESVGDVSMQRRLSNQSQLSNTALIPTAGSAFRNPMVDGAKQDPAVLVRNLAIPLRLSQRGVTMGKDIRSDHDILDEEVIRPVKSKPDDAPTNGHTPLDSALDDLQNGQTHEQPSVLQLIKYKQQIRTENDRRLHRQKLAELAMHQREKELSVQSDLMAGPVEIEQKQVDEDQQTPSTKAETGVGKALQKLSVKTKEEEDILDDENVFQPRKQRTRGRQKTTVTLSRANTPYIRGLNGPEGPPSTRRGDESFAPMMQFSICKKCGDIMSNDENLQRDSVPPTGRTFEPPTSDRSDEPAAGEVDDWFESASNVSGPRQVSPWIVNDSADTSNGSVVVRRNLFQPIKDGDADTRPLKTPRMSETGIFGRSPESKARRSSSSRSVPSPIPHAHPTDMNLAFSQQFQKFLRRSSSSKPIPSAASTPRTRTPVVTDRRMSEQSIHEHSPSPSEKN